MVICIMFTLAKPAESSSPSKASPSGSSLAVSPIKDPNRFRKNPEQTNDIARLMMIAVTSGGAPEAFLENPWLRQAFEKLQEGLVGHTLFKLPSRYQVAQLRGMEAVQARDELQGWLLAREAVTLAADGRKMAEGRGKESMLNSAVVACGEE